LFEIDGSVTREKVRALAVEWAGDPATVVEIVHNGLNKDELSGGYAFVCDKGLLIVGAGGENTRSTDPGDGASRLAAVDQWWHQSQHMNRRLKRQDLSVWHRAAISALVAGMSTVADLEPEQRVGVDDVARADFLLVSLRNRAADRTESAALRALASHDYLLEVPREDQRAHACPICGLPAIGNAWQYTTVCDSCFNRTACPHGRIVRGYNTSMLGAGFEAKHIDDSSVCEAVSKEHIVSIDGHRCRIGEAKFGGVSVGVDQSRTGSEAPAEFAPMMASHGHDNAPNRNRSVSRWSALGSFLRHFH
jgi:hypothetical protein